jgi:hypothetical protein
MNLRAHILCTLPSLATSLLFSQFFPIKSTSSADQSEHNPRTPAEHPKLQSAYAKLPLSFEARPRPNKLPSKIPLPHRSL